MDKWLITISNLLNIDRNRQIYSGYDGKKSINLSFEDFYNLCMQHPGWHVTIMNCGDAIVSAYIYDMTEDSLQVTREKLINYFADFINTAVKAGYKIV